MPSVATTHSPPSPQDVTIAVDNATRVSGVMLRPAMSKWCFVLAHGAGAGMRHPFMTAVADGLAALDIATLRYQFPFAERNSKRPDGPPLCLATVRAAVAEAARLAPGLALIAGGKSFGGRMTSQAQAAAALPQVRGLAFLGFPLHAPNAPSTARGEHLVEVEIPMLFLQGTRDALAQLGLIEALVKRLGARATLKPLLDADHSFHVPARTGQNDVQVRTVMLNALASWADFVIQSV